MEALRKPRVWWTIRGWLPTEGLYSECRETGLAGEVHQTMVENERAENKNHLLLVLSMMELPEIDPYLYFSSCSEFSCYYTLVISINIAFSWLRWLWLTSLHVFLEYIFLPFHAQEYITLITSLITLLHSSRDSLNSLLLYILPMSSFLQAKTEASICSFYLFLFHMSKNIWYLSFSSDLFHLVLTIPSSYIQVIINDKFHLFF